MIGNYYELLVECFGSRVTKTEMIKIQLDNTVFPSNTNLTLTNIQLPPINIKIPQPQVYSYGVLFHNRYINRCCLILPSPCGERESIQLQMNHQKMSQTTIPSCCKCYGPYQTTDKNGITIGQMRPHWYIYKQYCMCFLLHPCCMYLEIYDKSFNKVYTIEREPCTCCFSKWNVLDTARQIQGDIIGNGICCCCCCMQNVKIRLPKDNQDNKKLILNSIPFLP